MPGMKCRNGQRFIPALAGNTLPTGPAYVMGAVYPRSRGEHTHIVNCEVRYFGLSPLSRGTLALSGEVDRDNRFIPALAGNTSDRLKPANQLAVYPRSRGEHISLPALQLASYGLSPLSRGTLICVRELQVIERFIPALAGNTQRGSGRCPELPVYPRSRGEHVQELYHNQEKRGLSPLSRGTHVERHG